MENPISREELIQKIKAKENVSKVDDMSYLFIPLSEEHKVDAGFNKPLNEWVVYNGGPIVSNDKKYITIEELRKKIEAKEIVSQVDTYKIYDMSYLFSPDSEKHKVDNRFNQPLNEWDVSNAETMEGMFASATSFNQPLNDWDVSDVRNMSFMFYNATKFNQPLNEWDVSNVDDMQSMFYNATKFNQPLNDWNVSFVSNMVGMFAFAKNYTYSFKTWKLGTFKVRNFLRGCDLWHLFNTVEDLPMKNGERIDIGDRNIWKIL